MSTSEEIDVWLKDPQDYTVGVRLLLKVTKKFRLWSRIAMKENKHNRARLIHELKQALIWLKIEAIGTINLKK